MSNLSSHSMVIQLLCYKRLVMSEVMSCHSIVVIRAFGGGLGYNLVFTDNHAFREVFQWCGCNY